MIWYFFEEAAEAARAEELLRRWGLVPQSQPLPPGYGRFAACFVLDSCAALTAARVLGKLAYESVAGDCL